MDVWRTLDGHRSGRQLVAHNAAFDRRMINGELQREGGPPIAWMGCTMQLAKQLGYGGGYGAGGRSVALGALVSRLGLEVTPTHRALADAEAALELLRFFQRQHPNEVARLLAGRR
jgi:DNA polymerase-3 subunit epsilon